MPRNIASSRMITWTCIALDYRILYQVYRMTVSDWSWVEFVIFFKAFVVMSLSSGVESNRSI